MAVTVPPVTGAGEPVMTAASANVLGAGLAPGLGLIDGLDDGLGLVSVGVGVGVGVTLGAGVVVVTLGAGLWLGVTAPVQLGVGLAVALGLGGIGAGVLPVCRGSQSWFGGTNSWPVPLTPPPLV